MIPHSPELEVGALGCILANPSETTVELMSRYHAGSRLFYDERHKLLLERILEMQEDHVPVDSVTLVECLKNKGELAQCGGIPYLTKLWDGAVSGSNLSYYCDQLAELQMRRDLMLAGQEIGRLAEKPDANAAMDEAEKIVLSIGTQNRIGDDSSIKKALKLVLERLEAQHRGERRHIGYQTGLVDLDKTLGGLAPTELIIIAARPGRGKSALAAQFALEVALNHPTPVGIFSMEMSRDELVERMISMLSGVCASEVDKNTTRGEFDKIAKATLQIANSGIRISDRGGLSVMACRSLARRMVNRHKVGMIVVDYLQLMHASKNDTRATEVSEITRGLKALAMELKIPVVALSQLNRLCETEERKPRLSDLRESGSIEQDANKVIMVHWLGQEQRDEHGLWYVPVELIVEKNRGGRTGAVKAQFIPSLTKFRSETRKVEYDSET